MFCLSVLHRLNDEAVSNYRPDGDGVQYLVTYLGFGRIQVSGNDKHILIDASNPRDDRNLTAFHREFTGPSHIKHRVDMFASQWRRICTQ